MKRLSSLCLALAMFLLVSCAAPIPEETSLWDQIARLAGERLSLGDHGPDDFPNQPVSQVYALHQAGEDIWLYGSDSDFDQQDPDGALRAWLEAISALHFPQEGAHLYWIPADARRDRLLFAEKHELTHFIEPAQLVQLYRQRATEARRNMAYEAAIADYDRVLALDPQDVEANAGKGAALLGINENELAVESFQRALAINPDHYWSRRLLGNAYLNLQRYGLAADELTQAYILNPDDVRLLLGIALAQGRSGDPERALKSLTMLSSLTEDPELLADAEALRREFSASPPQARPPDTPPTQSS